MTTIGQLVPNILFGVNWAAIDPVWCPMFSLAEEPAPGLLQHYTLLRHGWKFNSAFICQNLDAAEI